MNEKPATLETFFGFSRGSARGSEEFAAMEAGLPAARVEEAVKKANDNRAVPISSAAFIAAIGGILNVPLLDIIVRAWNEGKLFRKYLDPETYDPEEVISITLKEHEVTSTHQPKIDVVLNGQTIDSIEFQLDVVLTLEGVILQVQGGNIRKVQSGRVKGKCTIKCENMILFERKTEAMDLPGTVQFPEPATAGAAGSAVV
jgi:hypothetical protein